MGRLLSGILADRFLGNYWMLTFHALHSVVVLAVWSFTLTAEVGWGIFWALNFGFAYGGFLTVWSGLVFDVVGSRYYVQSWGLMTLVYGLPGTALSASMYGVLREQSGSYMLPSLVSAGGMVAAVISVALVQARHEGPPHPTPEPRSSGVEEVEV